MERVRARSQHLLSMAGCLTLLADMAGCSTLLADMAGVVDFQVILEQRAGAAIGALAPPSAPERRFQGTLLRRIAAGAGCIGRLVVLRRMIRRICGSV